LTPALIISGSDKYKKSIFVSICVLLLLGFFSFYHVSHKKMEPTRRFCGISAPLRFSSFVLQALF
jgi:hypothetical protein